MDFNTYPSVSLNRGPRAQCCVCKTPASTPDMFCWEQKYQEFRLLCTAHCSPESSSTFSLLYERKKKVIKLRSWVNGLSGKPQASPDKTLLPGKSDPSAATQESCWWVCMGSIWGPFVKRLRITRGMQMWRLLSGFHTSLQKKRTWKPSLALLSFCLLHYWISPSLAGFLKRWKEMKSLLCYCCSLLR